MKMTAFLTQVKGVRAGWMVDIFKIAMPCIQYHRPTLLLQYMSLFLLLSTSCDMIF